MIHYLIFICSIIFPILIIFGNEYSKLNIFLGVCFFGLLILSSMKIYMQDKERKRREEYIEYIKDERNYIYDLIEKNAKEMTFEELKKYYGDYITSEEELKQKEEEKFRKYEKEYAESLKHYWQTNGKKIRERLKELKSKQK